MTTEQMLREIDNLLDKLSIGVELGDTIAIKEYHKLLKTKAELKGIFYSPTERMSKPVNQTFVDQINDFFHLITRDEILTNAAKRRIAQLAEIMAEKNKLERLL